MSNLDLTLHGDAEEHDEIHNKDRPEHWHIEGFEECANHSNDDAFRRRMPESANKETKYYLETHISSNTYISISTHPVKSMS